MNKQAIQRLSPLTMLGACLATIALILAPVSPRFDYAPLNYLAAMALAMLLPFSLCWLALRIRARGWQAGMTGLALLTWLPALAFVFMASYPLRTALAQSETAEDEPVASLRSGGDHYRLYRLSGGARSSWSVLLRRETPLLPGLKLVRDVERRGHTYSAYLCEAPANGGVTLSQDPCDSVNQY
ncbi:hypothetical protein [Pseudoduganella violacea]|uniref:Uncharacterized protein n=1 Tax=Pseudoduganella violacea TaxID=1715466 RepID=A0A7W5BEG7_9BURK|nr:hypothetical protein [Pseudoduganella violacea]MBB3121633.1 hypothetical protein [Pseudoduganella violacea]